ncbi:uncharacterized protein SETTUDRAFT_36815 [Exserohilum turcica Et28A]|uniref:Uncharacterized protein n=1 Tax=Exserohilum turcicum (strain 28A) TaxID=671987 RepID=R0KQV0_EXST2|nr:uncharacterized protein SETTUDRAFT_36815 [Exserohilum turcica Et28A]EOA90162.1 hypothetical protein SETTUDRAFT_36815 [Exserohilum turcica Et28A]
MSCTSNTSSGNNRTPFAHCTCLAKAHLMAAIYMLIRMLGHVRSGHILALIGEGLQSQYTSSSDNPIANGSVDKRCVPCVLEYPTGIKADDSNAVVKDPGISWTREIHPSELYLPKTEAWFLPLGLVDAEKRHWWSTLHPYLSQARDNCGFLALGLRLRDTEQNFQNKLESRVLSAVIPKAVIRNRTGRAVSYQAISALAPDNPSTTRCADPTLHVPQPNHSHAMPLVPCDVA